MVELSLPFESRYFPSKKFYDVYQRSIEEPEEFWAEQARQLDWFKTWDKVILYLSMIPELSIFILACARIDAIHTVVFSGFSAQALADRTNDVQAGLLVTADGGFRRGKVIPLKR